MKRFFKYLGLTIAAILGLLLLIVFLLYLPPVQDLLRRKAVEYVSSRTGWVVRLGEFRLGFPLDLQLKDVYAGPTATDTLVSVETLRLKVGLGGILRQEVSVDDLQLEQVTFALSNDTTGMRLRVRTEKLALNAPAVELRNKAVHIDHILLEEGQVFLTTGNHPAEDTTVSKPLDWSFLVNRIQLHQVSYAMESESLPYLGAGIAEATLENGRVGLQQQHVTVDSLEVAGGWCRMKTAPGKEEKNTAGKADTIQAVPWTVEAGALRLENSAFTMENGGKDTVALVLSGIGVRIDSVYNRGTVVRGVLKDLQATQQGGIQLLGMQGDIDLDTNMTALRGASIRTPYSRLQLNAEADTSVQELLKKVPLAVTLTGQIGLRDVAVFYDGIPAAVLGNTVDVNTSFTMTENRIRVGQIILAMPGHFRITGSGRLSGYKDYHTMTGNFDLKGELPDVRFAQPYLEQTGVFIPRDLSMLAHLKAKRGDLEALLRLCCGQGCLELDGSYQVAPEAYRGELALNNFPLERFLPQDSLGAVSATIRAEGRGFSWQQAKAEATAHVRQFFYRRHVYQDITLLASLNKTQLRGDLTSEDPDFPLDLIFRGDSVGQAYQVELGGHLGEVDLKALHFVPDSLEVAMDLEIQAVLAPEENYTVEARLDSLRIADARNRYRLGNLFLQMKSDREKTTLDMASGDLKLAFQTDTSLTAFSRNIGKVAQVIRQQMEDRNINMEVVRRDLPLFSLKLEGARDNAIAGFLKTRNIGFKNVVFDVVSRKRSGLRLGFQANAPYFGSVKLDSVQLGMWQTGKSLVYAASAGSSAEAWKGLFNVNVSGRMQGNQLRLELRQKNAQGKIGFDLGVNLTMQDSVFSVSFFPMNPILGYSRWIVNADNRVTISKTGKVEANLRMAYLNKLVSIQSLGTQGDQKDRLQVEIAGVQLDRLSELVPFMPELDGELNTNVLLYSRDNMLGAEGKIEVENLFYQKQRIGTLDLGLQYAAGTQFTHHVIDFELKIDSIRRAVVKGEFSTSTTQRDLMVDVDIPSLPLYVVNAFVPADIMRLGGELTGAVHFRGTVDQPLLNGELAFQQGKVDVVMIGTTFALDPAPIAVHDGKILFRQYRFIAPNNSDMVLDGNIALTPFNQMGMDLTVKANNFEVVNVKKNTTSLIYGKAYADIDTRISGAFSALNLSGNVNLLNQTAITYTLRSADPQLVDHSVDLVRFVSFRDSTLNEQDELTNRVKNSSFTLKMLIEIGNEVSVEVDLSEDGSNNIFIQGGGNLVLAMNPESGMTLSGKYILTNGTVVYNVPIAGKKEFSIRNGSYVEWTGNVMNPTLNISASEQVKATVEDGERNRLVTFESIIRIQNTLNRPDITFDLSAPNDMVIQNQLATFSQEERTRQALNLLIYNTYTAPGAAKSGSGGSVANNALYSFVENELNKYTRKVGLTVGMDSYNTDENNVRTDVTYQFSKQLFNDRVRVKIGGRISTDNNDPQNSSNLEDNLVDDISIEYVFTKKRNLFLKVFRHSNYESVLDGEVTQTGVGIVWRKEFRKFKDLFKSKKKKERLHHS